MLAGSLKFIVAQPIHVSEMSVLATQTFHETYAAYNTKDDMEAYCDFYFNEEVLRKELERTQNQYYLILDNEKLVAYAFVKSENCKLDTVQKPALEIHRIYVLRSYQGKKIGNFLMQKIIELGKKKKYKSIWLGVWKKNIHAIAFYLNYGFQICGNTIFILGSDVQEDYLMYVDL